MAHLRNTFSENLCYFPPQNKTKSISKEDIVRKAQCLKEKGVQFDVIVSQREGFWGQMCKALGIPNSKKNRQKILKCHGLQEVHITSVSKIPLRL